jgi:hypothetical protein
MIAHYTRPQLGARFAGGGQAPLLTTPPGEEGQPA